MILKNARLIPALAGGLNIPLADVIIRKKKIDAILPAGSEISDDDSFDCKGMTLLPGLLDIHSHVSMDRNKISYDPMNDALNAYTYGALESRKYLDYGYTTIRDLASNYSVAIYIRDAIEAGLFHGPRIITSGCIISGTDNSHNNDPAFRMANGNDQVREAVRDIIARGADLIKIYNSSRLYRDKKHAGFPLYDMEELKTIVNSAALKGTYVAAHCHDTLSINMNIDAGIRTLEHASLLDDAALEKLALGQSFLVPTMAAFLSYMNHVRKNKKDQQTGKSFIDEFFEKAIESHKKAYKGGLKFGFGSDSLVGEWNEKQGYEFKARKELLGMKDLDILVQATKDSAEIIGLGDEIGQVREGFVADLIVIDGKPDKDVSIMCSEKPRLVLSGGVKVR